MSSSNILVLDNDETTGHYTNTMNYMFHALRSITKYNKTDQEMLDIVIQHGNRCGIFRPGVQAFLQDVYKRKKAGALDAVVMYTNAPLRNNIVWNSQTWGPLTWQQFLSKVLGTLAGSTDLFDVVICRKPEDALHPYPLKSFERIVAHLPAHLRTNTRMMFFDDRTDDILGKSELHTCVKVVPYRVRLPIHEIYPAIQDIFDGNEVSCSLSEFNKNMRTDWFAHELHKYALKIESDLVENGCFDGVTLDMFFPYPEAKDPEPEIVDIDYTAIASREILVACAQRLWAEYRSAHKIRKAFRKCTAPYNRHHYTHKHATIHIVKHKRKI
jgi:hypothetical protein